MTESQIAAKKHALTFAFLRHFHREIPSACLQGIPAHWDAVQTLATVDPEVLNLPLEMIFQPIHYSWILHAIKQDGSSMEPLWCAALPHHVEALKRTLSLDTTLPLVNDPSKQYLLYVLYHRLECEQILPLAFLPPSPLNRLTQIDKRTLVRLLDYLGIFDLAAIIRRSVLPSMRQQIQTMLTATQSIELERALQSQDILPPTQTDLQRSITNPQELHRFLQLQGLARLGKILGRSDASLVWHIAHHLDIGRGQTLLRTSQYCVEPALEKRLANQLDSLLNRLAR